MEPRIVMFKKEKETKGTIRFTEVTEKGQPEVIGTLYVKKWFAGDATAVALTVALTE
jgi:hypothetical protein